MVIELYNRTDARSSPVAMAYESSGASPGTAPAGERCPLCGGAGGVVWEKNGAPLRLCSCVEGGTLLAWAFPSERAYEALYRRPRAYHVREQRAEGQVESYLRDAEHLAAAYSRVSILTELHGECPRSCTLVDIGSGMGGFVQAAREAGYQAFGLEPSPDARDWANAHGRPTSYGDWRALHPTWDIVTLHDVFEHLTRPLSCLRHIAGCLAPTGILIIEAPEWDGPRQREEGWNWRHIRPRQHVCLYSRGSAEALFERAGFQVRAFWRPVAGTLGKASWLLKRIE